MSTVAYSVGDGACIVRTLADVESERVARAAGQPTRLIVGLAGYKGSGKSSVADFLVARYGFESIPFAGPLKDMMRAAGSTESEIEGDLKETSRDWLCGKTPRHAMQTLGTEWGRELIGADFWTGLWARRVAATTKHVVVPDLRFLTEARTLRSLGARLYFVERNSATPEGDRHQSERECRLFSVDGQIFNNDDLIGLYERVARLADSLLSDLENGVA